MFVDARTVPDNQILETDICIVGAGAAGITLAREFAGQSLRVIVLESGGLEPDAGARDLSDGENVGLPYFPLAIARLRYFGGTTNHWGGICRPFDAVDFEARSWIPNSGWPLTRDELQPYYDRAQVACNLGPREWTPGYWLARAPFPALQFGGSRIITRMAQVVPSAERRFGLNHRGALEKAGNVTIYLHANLTEIATNETATSVRAIRVACIGGGRFSVRARAFILATGAIENARLLLLSNRRQPAGLGNQHDQVGRYFMEHPRLAAARWIPANPRLPIGLYSLHRAAGAILHGYLNLTQEVLRREELLDVQIDLDPVYEQSYDEALEGEEVTSLKTMLSAFRSKKIPDDLGRHITNVLSDLTTWQRHVISVAPVPLPPPEVIRQIWRTDPTERTAFIAELFGDIVLSVYSRRYGGLPIDHVLVSPRVEQAPNPLSRVMLGPDRDQLGLNRVRLDWRLTELERRSMMRSLEILGAELGRAGLGRLQITLPEDDSWPETLRGGWHHMGTTRMSDDPRRGVVDRNCRVHGVANLFIAGSSVFATAGSGTPTFTLVSLAIRLADHLKQRLT